MKHDFITTDRQFGDYVSRLAGAEWIAFDTEFVSEDSYRPLLCLIQVATPAGLAVIDTLQLSDLRPFWQLLAEGEQQTIVHAGRQEVEFSLLAVERPPARLFDVQIAAGLVGLEYPASYGNLIAKVLGQTAQKGETRTDWRRRPLSDRQIAYALVDVDHLVALRDKLVARLDKASRLGWLEAEMAAWLADIQGARSRERWRRVAGSSGLSSRSLAIVRELWLWRETEAERRDWPVRRVLRDDLLAELAKRKSADPKQIRAVRGMERGDITRLLPQLSAAVERALNLPEAECPAIIRNDSNSQLAMLGQFLSSALNSICRSAGVATSMVGTASDVRDLIAYRLAGSRANPAEVPALAEGWRAEVVGQVLEDLLMGKLAIRIADPKSDQPLAFDRLEQ